ncbi:hypothetical protein TWF225_007794 [Orbilia oligospora]|uniref:Uncharacterized protein n=1 Tax=Orbilia oligospora TaxID=2813651 RepID=A0A7C8P4Y0_ORBOL|nr:hypothetical protein TWF751_010692 [Orbilia oligospora]KAF3178769.1 hypothetical protein TWF225_007794 [Orbilia oligospora]KAF3245642.1 hypothetical protein TWF128_009356 [Orbilia oligospora]KAF3257308.1 hypothetical protein TWF217_006049 [Orbilia oligospora]KAF3279347.1 hypothetical protein TWF132_000619 [Orbilia oligospora]
MTEIYALLDYTDDKSYVQPLIESALHKHLPSLHLLHNNPTTPPLPSTTPLLTWTSYESLDFQTLLSNPTTNLFNAYIIRKALIRKHYLLHTIESYVKKNPGSVLKDATPVGVEFEVDYVEFLDEALVEAYELVESLERNEGEGEKGREWWILKPGMSDRGVGIRLFSTMGELQGIFEGWEEESDDEDDDDDDEDEDKATRSDGEGEEGEDIKTSTDDKEKKSTGIITSSLRHFVAQIYIPPFLLTPKPNTNNPSNIGPRKFHIRTYVLAYSALKIYVYKNMLALFAAKEYTPPSSSTLNNNGDDTSGPPDLSAHLTNTCLQSGVHDGSVIPFWNLPEFFIIDQTKVEEWYSQVCEITAEVFKAAVSGGRIHFQPLPNAFEIFGFDFLVGEDGKVRVLEVNAFPDFRQTGEEEKELVAGLFEGVVGVVKTFFGEKEEEDGRMVKVLDVDVGGF